MSDIRFLTSEGEKDHISEADIFDFCQSDFEGLSDEEDDDPKLNANTLFDILDKYTIEQESDPDISEELSAVETSESLNEQQVSLEDQLVDAVLGSSWPMPENSESVAKTEAVETNDQSQLPKGDVSRKVLIQFIEDGPEFSPRGFKDILAKVMLVINKCSCSAEEVQCQCCFSIDSFNATCCLRLRYSQPESAIKASVIWNEKDILDFDISVASITEGSPTCVSNAVSGFAQVCFNFYKAKSTDESKENMQACGKVDLKVLSRKVYGFNIGCVELGMGKAISIASDVNKGPDHVTVELNEEERKALNLTRVQSA